MNETTHEQPGTNDDNAEVNDAEATAPGKTTVSGAEPTPSERTPWLSYSRGTRFGGYLGIWVSVYFVLDLVTFAAGSGEGAETAMWVALIVLATLPGQLLVGPAVCAALAWGNVRFRPLAFAMPFLLIGFPVCLGVTRVFASVIWQL